ncbi:MAG: hypothetical protein ABI980_08900 [Nitrospirota bacterium]
MMGKIKKGDRIEAKVNDQNHALPIRSAQQTDTSHGHKSWPYTRAGVIIDLDTLTPPNFGQE